MTPVTIGPSAETKGPMLSGTPGEIRTPDRLVRSQELCPAELRAQIGGRKKGQAAMPDPLFFGGEPRWDRTNDHLIKSQVLYLLS